MWRMIGSDKALVEYLLGELPDKARDRLEERYFNDDALHEKLLAVEEELIDAYLRGELSAEQREHFESRFLCSEERREKVNFARALLGHIAETPAPAPAVQALWWESVSAFFQTRSPAVRLAFVAAGLAVVVVPAVIWNLGRRPSPTGQQVADLPRGVRQQPQQERAPVLSLVLVPVQRSGGRGNTLAIPPGAYEVRLELDLEGNYYDRYGVVLQTAEGKQIGQFDGLKPEPAAGGGKSVQVTVSSEALSRGDYLVKLRGVADDGTVEEAGGYSFQVVRSR